MSIYRQHGWNDLDEVQQFGTPPNAAAPKDSPPSGPSAGSHDWSKQRKALPADRLLPLSKKWLDLLPPDVFPSALATRYPRIVNLIAIQWNDRGGFSAYLNELLVGRRVGRQGFPVAVKRELENLLDYWCTGGRRRTNDARAAAILADRVTDAPDQRLADARKADVWVDLSQSE